MNLTNSAVALSVALATGLVFAGSNALEPFEKLNLDSGAQWFAAPSTGGSWSETPSAGETQGYLEVDSDSAHPLTFTISAALGEANVISDISLDMVASPVPASVELAAPALGTKIGFAIKKTATASEYWAYLGSVWAKLSDETPVAEGSACTLKIQLDRRQTPTKVRFWIKPLPDGSYLPISDWKPLSGTTSIGTTAAIDFVGSGEIKDLAGVKYTILSEKIDVKVGTSDVSIVIPEAIMTDLQKAAGSKKVGEYLNESSGVGGMTRLDAKVLFNKTELTAADKTVVKGAPAEATAGKVRVAVAGLDVQAIGGATVTYQLEGSVDGSAWTEIGTPQTSPDLEFDQSTPYRYFHVKTMVDYSSVNN